MDGIVRCSRYAFGPNKLHYCGPDKNRELFAYLQEGESDPALVKLLSQFEAMYPYLTMIAESNRIQNVLDDRVVEAYWLGNELLDRVPKQKFYTFLADTLGIKRKLTAKNFTQVADKISRAVPHHSFHVFDVWRKNPAFEKTHTVKSLDKCRIGWGMITKIDGPFIFAEIEPIAYVGGKLQFGPLIEQKFIRKLESEYDIEQLAVGDLVSIHWDTICEKISKKQFDAVRKYTKRHMELANETF